MDNERKHLTSEDIVRRVLTDDKTGAPTATYFKTGFLSEAMDLLWRIRQQAGLSQEQLAKLLKTKQPSIARWETDLSGTISLNNCADFALACGMVPVLTMVELSEARAMEIKSPGSFHSAGMRLSQTDPAEYAPGFWPPSHPPDLIHIPEPADRQDQIIMPTHENLLTEIEMSGGPSFQIASDGNVRVHWEDEEDEHVEN